MKFNQRGFTYHFVLIAIAVVAVIGLVFWRVITSQKKSSTILDNTNVSTEEINNEEIVNVQEQLKQFVDEKAFISFSYPSNWSLTENLTENEYGHNVGNIILESPNGLKLYIKPNEGGKGGSCDIYDSDVPHDTYNCSTQEILSKEKTTIVANIYENDNSNLKEVYLLRIKYTPGKQNNPNLQTIYSIILSNSNPLIMGTSEPIGAWFGLGIIFNKDKLYVNTNLVGNMLADENFLESNDAKTAETILKSINLL